MRRVLMVSPHFPPDTSAGTHRVRLFAPYLPEFGGSPRSSRLIPPLYEGRLDPDLRRARPGQRSCRPHPGVECRGDAPDWPSGTSVCGAFAGLRRTCETRWPRERFDVVFITITPTYPAMLGPMLKRRHGASFVLDYQDPWVSRWGLDVLICLHGLLPRRRPSDRFTTSPCGFIHSIAEGTVCRG